MSITCSPQPKATPQGKSSSTRREASWVSIVVLRAWEERPESSQIEDLVKGQHRGFPQSARARNPLNGSYTAYSPTIVLPTQQEEANNSS